MEKQGILLWNSLKLRVVSGFNGVTKWRAGRPGINTPIACGGRAGSETGWLAGSSAAMAWIESRTRWKAGQGAGVVQQTVDGGANVEKTQECGKTA